MVLDDDTDLEIAPVKAPAHAPPKVWVNWLWLPCEIQTPIGVIGPGDVPGRVLWPSKDIAETQALKWFGKNMDWVARVERRTGQKVTYLGAYKEGDRP